MLRMRTLFRSGILLAILVVVATARAGAEDLNDYRLLGAGAEARHYHPERRGVGVLAR